MFGLSRLFKRRDPTVQDVAKELLPLLQQAKPGTSFSYEGEMDVIRSSDGGVISITNLHVEYLRASAERRPELLRRFAQSMAAPEMPARLEEARAHLLPALRHLAGLDQARLLAGDPNPNTILEGMRPFSDELGVGVVYDTEHSMAQVSVDKMKQWGLSEEQLHEIAIDNLRHKAPPSFGALSPGLYVSSYGDYYDAARILLPELVYQLGLGGNPVAMAPNRICLFVASDQDPRAQREMIEKAREVLLNEPRPLSAEIFRLIDGAWASWTPEDPAAAASLRDLQLQLLSSDYESQKQVLDNMHQQAGKDIFVGSYTLVQNKEGRLLSYSVLTKGVDTWLPRTDVVMLVDLDKPKGTEPKIVEWSALMAALGATVEQIECRPPRYQVLEHMSEQEIAALPSAVI